MNRQRYSPWGYGRQMPQGQGFYNPYMKTPDWGQGMRSLMQSVMMARQISQEREQREQQKKQLERQKELWELQMRKIKREEDVSLEKRSGLRWLGQKFPQAEPWTAAGKMPPKEIMAEIAGIQPEKKLTATQERISYLKQGFPDVSMQNIILMATKTKPLPSIPEYIEPEYEKFLTSQWGEDWKNKITPQQFDEWRDEFQLRTRPTKVKDMTSKGHLGWVKALRSRIQKELSVVRGEQKGAFTQFLASFGEQARPELEKYLRLFDTEISGLENTLQVKGRPLEERELKKVATINQLLANPIRLKNIIDGVKRTHPQWSATQIIEFIIDETTK